MNYAIILSGGIGSRLGTNTPKQYLEVGNRPIISYCIETFANHPDINELIIVCANEWQNLISEEMKSLTNKTPIFAEPGETRQLSILNGLKVIPQKNDDDWVIIHDAARPNLSTELISECFRVRHENYDGALPVIPVKDTIYQSKDSQNISGLIDRSTLFAGQAPESFNLTKYIKAHENISKEELLKINGSTEIAYKMGLKIKLINGDVNNFKITDSSDLERFKNSLK